MEMEINICPSCGSRRIAKLRRDWDGDFEGKRYVVRDLEYYECPVCGEQVFDREEMRKIEARSPAFA
jgi:YgiT-type zinc finger domain-containing protein